LQVQEVYSPATEGSTEADEEIAVEDNNEQDKSDSSKEEDVCSEDEEAIFPDTSISVLPLEGEDEYVILISVILVSSFFL